MSDQNSRAASGEQGAQVLIRAEKEQGDIQAAYKESNQSSVYQQLGIPKSWCGPLNCLNKAKAIQSNSDPWIREIPFGYHNCISELVIIVSCFITALLVLRLLCSHVFYKKITQIKKSNYSNVLTHQTFGPLLLSASNGVQGDQKQLQQQHMSIITRQYPQSKRNQLKIEGPARELLLIGSVSNLFRSKKFYILAIGLILSTVSFLHYFIEIDNGLLKQQISMIELFLRYAGIYMVTYYVLQKATKSLDSEDMAEQRQDIQSKLNFIYMSSFAFNVTFIAYLEYQMAQVSNQGLADNDRLRALSRISCDSPIWLTGAFYEFFIVIIFFTFVRKIDRSLNKLIETKKRDCYFADDKFENEYRNKRNLSLIITFYLAMVCYQLVFSLVSYGWALHIQDCTNPDHQKNHSFIQCNVITNIPEIDTWFWLVSRTLSDIGWQLPMIYIFWPKYTRGDPTMKRRDKNIASHTAANKSRSNSEYPNRFGLYGTESYAATTLMDINSQTSNDGKSSFLSTINYYYQQPRVPKSPQLISLQKSDQKQPTDRPKAESVDNSMSFMADHPLGEWKRNNRLEMESEKKLLTFGYLGAQRSEFEPPSKNEIRARQGKQQSQLAPLYDNQYVSVDQQNARRQKMQLSRGHFFFNEPLKKQENDSSTYGPQNDNSESISKQSNLSIQSRDQGDDSDADNRNEDSWTFKQEEKKKNKRAGSFRESSSSISQIVCLTASQTANVAGVRTKKNYMNDQLN